LFPLPFGYPLTGGIPGIIREAPTFKLSWIFSSDWTFSWAIRIATKKMIIPVSDLFKLYLWLLKMVKLESNSQRIILFL
jgi:hypothetical protein